MSDELILFTSVLRKIFGMNFLIWKFKEEAFDNKNLKYSKLELERLLGLTRSTLERYEQLNKKFTREYIENTDILCVLIYCYHQHMEGPLIERLVDVLDFKNEIISKNSLRMDDLFYDKLKLVTIYNLIESFSFNETKFQAEKLRCEREMKTIKNSNKFVGEELILFQFYSSLLEFYLRGSEKAEYKLFECQTTYFDNEQGISKRFKKIYNIRVQLLFSKIFEKQNKISDTISALKTLKDELKENKDHDIELYLKICLKICDLHIYNKIDDEGTFNFLLEMLNHCNEVIKSTENFTSKTAEFKYSLSINLMLIYLNLLLGKYELCEKLVKTCKVLFEVYGDKLIPDFLRNNFYSNTLFLETLKGNIEKGQKYYNQLKTKANFLTKIVSLNNLAVNFFENNDIKSSTSNFLISIEDYQKEDFFQKNIMNSIYYMNSLILLHHHNYSNPVIENQISFFKNLNSSLINSLASGLEINDFSEIYKLYYLYNIAVFRSKNKTFNNLGPFSQKNPLDIYLNLKDIMEKSKKIKLIEICKDLYFNIIINICNLLITMGKFSEIQEIFEKFKDKFDLNKEKSNNLIGLGSRIYKLKGDADFYLKYYNDSVESYKFALKLIGKINNSKEEKNIPVIQVNLGISYLLKNDLVNSEHYFLLALEIYKASNKIDQEENTMRLLNTVQNLSLNRSAINK